MREIRFFAVVGDFVSSESWDDGRFSHCTGSCIIYEISRCLLATINPMLAAHTALVADSQRGASCL